MKIKRIRHRLITIMIIVCIVLVIMMFVGGKKDSYYGIMKDSTTIDKMINTKDEKLEKLLKLRKLITMTYLGLMSKSMIWVI